MSTPAGPLRSVPGSLRSAPESLRSAPGSLRSGTLDVSVVVPVYNTGRYLDVLVEGIMSQTLPRDRFEVIFVDDGSTDETPARLDALAAEHDWITVVHQPNSGWPGQPRNLGTDLARGDYVFFHDHDDRLGPEALERMVVMARRNRSDVVVPKMVNRGRPVPRALFQATVDRADLLTSPLIHSSMTPHKLFRRAWLNEHGLRYPEGRRRLEDGVFVMDAYLTAETISILADYPCYYRYGRDDGGNAALVMWEPTSYFGFVEEIIDVIDRHTEPGDELRRALYRRPYTLKLLDKLFGRRLFFWTPEIRAEIFDVVRSVMLRRFPADFADDVLVLTRAHARAVYDDRLDQLMEVAKCVSALTATAALTSVNWGPESWSVGLTAEVAFDDGTPVRLIPMAGGWAIDERLIPSELSAAPYTSDDLMRRAGVDITLLNVAERYDWHTPAGPEPTLVPIVGDPDGAHKLVFRGETRISPSSAAAGRPLAAGEWRLRARLHALGFVQDSPIAVPRALAETLEQPVLIGSPPVEAHLTRQRRRGLSLVVSEPHTAAAELVVGQVRELRLTDAGTVKAPLNARIAASATRQRLRLVVLDDEGLAVARRPAALKLKRRGAVLTSQLVDLDAGRLAAGRFRLAVQDDSGTAYLLGRIEVDRRGRPRLLKALGPKPVTVVGDRPVSTTRRIVNLLEREARSRWPL